jgi:tetratricopeptide (TPR) repeat protein
MRGWLDRDPANVALRNDLAASCLQLGRPDQAATHYEAVRHLQPDSAAAHFNADAALALAGQSGRAIEAYQAALRLAPEFAAAHNGLGKRSPSRCFVLRPGSTFAVGAPRLWAPPPIDLTSRH